MLTETTQSMTTESTVLGRHDAHPVPQKRDLHFALDPATIGTWNQDCAHLSHFMNTLSLFFPVGERFFIQSVRAHATNLPTELVEPVRAFIAQEALHGREHDVYNQLFFEHVPAARTTEQRVAKLLREFQQRAPARSQLAVTMALEHLTAIMAEGLLSDPRLHEGMHADYRDLWLWHALEETEHKSVAFDVWLHAVGTGPIAYLRRCLALVNATNIFALLIVPTFLRALARDGALTDWKGWQHFAGQMFGRVGFLRKLVLPWWSYFKPSFHPWDHDNRARLADLDTLAKNHTRVRREAAA
jgi:uncharacterized protein